jgi:hypothetical protein
MNKSLRDIELIERYFDPDVSETEKEILAEEIEKDENLMALFKQEKLLINTIRFTGAKQDLHFLHNLENELSKADRRSIPRYYYAIAASVAIFVLIGVSYQFGKSSSPDVYAEYFKPYPNLFEPTVRGNAATNKRADGFLAYENGNYEKAINVFSDLLKEKKEPGIMLLSANANLALGRIDNSERILQDLISSFDELDIQAKWYLALCYLKSGQKEKSTALMQELTQSDLYATKAKGVLQKLQ